MTKADNQDPSLVAEVEDLKARLAEAEDTLRAIRSGEVDALVVSGPAGPRVFTLKGEERTYRVLVESVNEGALTLTPDGTIMYANSAFARMLGVPLERIMASSIDAFVIESDQDALQSLLRAGRRFASRRELGLKRSHDGEPLPAYVSVGPMTLEGAHALSVIVTDLTEAKRTERELTEYRDHLEELVQDRTEELETSNEELRAVTEEVQSANSQLLVEIDERAHTEEALRQSEERFRLLYETMLQGVVHQDAAGRIMSMNPAAVRILGKTPEEFLGETSVSVEHDTIRPDGTPFPGAEHPAMVALRTGHKVQNVVMGVYNPREGGYRWIEVDAVPLFGDDAAEPYQVYTIFSDITERKQAEEELRDLAQRLSLHMENSPLAVIEWNPEYRIIRWSNEAERVFGWTAEEMIGKHIDEVRWVYEEDWPIVNKLIGDMNAGVRPRNVSPNRNYRKDGSIIYCEWYNSVLRDPSGNVRSILSLVLDVTEREQAEAGLRDAFEREHHISQVLQKAIVPGKPVIGDEYPTAAAYLPAFVGEEVGGDFYDVFPIDDGRIGMLIGDVSGKGVEAASLASMTRSTVRALAHLSTSPGEAMLHANEVLCRAQTGGAFVTVHLSFLDCESGRVVSTSAGHPPAAVLRPDGRVEFYSAGGPPLGVLSEQEYPEDEYVLDPGDVVILYTDGVNEARAGHNLFGTNGIERVLRAHAGKGPQCICNELLAAIKAWTDGNLRDDTAIVVIQRKP